MKKRYWNVPLGELLDVEGVVAEDVLSRSGALVLPMGLSLAALKETRPEIVSQLLRLGITHVRVKSTPAITAEEFRSALGDVQPPIAELNPLLTRIAIHQFRVLYTNIDDRSRREDGVRSLMEFARRLPREIRRTPQITLSLVAGDCQEDAWPYVHAVNVALLSGYVAQRVAAVLPGLVEDAVLGGLLHDIGKAFFPQDARGPEGRVLPGPSRTLNAHPLLGETMLRDVGVTRPHILGAVRSHHERWDGKGVPDRLAGEAIPLSARIVAVANLFDNMMGARWESAPCRCDQALTRVIGLGNVEFDCRVVRALLGAIGLYPPGTVVLLSDGRVGIVLETRERNLLCPRVLVCSDAQGRRTPFEILSIRREGTVFIREALDDFGRRKLEALKAKGA